MVGWLECFWLRSKFWFHQKTILTNTNSSGYSTTSWDNDFQFWKLWLQLPCEIFEGLLSVHFYQVWTWVYYSYWTVDGKMYLTLRWWHHEKYLWLLGCDSLYIVFRMPGMSWFSGMLFSPTNFVIVRIVLPVLDSSKQYYIYNKPSTKEEYEKNSQTA